MVDISSCCISADASRIQRVKVMQFLYNIPGLKPGFPPISSGMQLLFLVLQCHRPLEIKVATAEELNGTLDLVNL